MKIEVYRLNKKLRFGLYTDNTIWYDYGGKKIGDLADRILVYFRGRINDAEIKFDDSITKYEMACFRKKLRRE